MARTLTSHSAATVTAPAATPDALRMASGTVLTVGAGMEFATLADAAKAAVGGDTIAVNAGTYINDFTTIKTDVHIVAVGGMVNEVATQPPPNDKAIITVDANLSIQGFTFTGGSDGSPDGNVSGIRLEYGSLAVNYCYFHDMQEGLLAGANAAATVTINHSEFARNGTGDGYTHNLYVGAVASLTVTNSYFHDAVVGHEIKSRAAITTITNNVIADGANGTASYDIDMPNAGVGRIANNLIEKGQNASNYYAIHYGGEGQYAWANNSLSVTGNTILNDLGSTGVGVLNQSAVNLLTVSAVITANRFYGFDPARLAMGASTMASNTTLSGEPRYSTASPWTAAPIVALSTGPQLLNLSNGGHTINGSAAKLTVQDSGGYNTINGGSTSLVVTGTASWDLINTQATAASLVTLSGRNVTVHSAGHDHIAALGLYEEVDATGQATITGATFSTYNLNGAGETLTTGGSGVLNVGAAGQASVTDAAGDLKFSLAAGGAVTINNVAGSVQGGIAGVATISGGAASGWIGSGGGIFVTTGDGGAAVQAGTGIVSVVSGAGADVLSAGSGTDSFTLGAGADQLTFGSGKAAATGGGGADTYVFANGSHGTDIITGFRQGKDTLQFKNFAAAAIASGTVAGGSTMLTLSDGTTIDLVGVALPGYGAPTPPAPPPLGGNPPAPPGNSPAPPGNSPAPPGNPPAPPGNPPAPPVSSNGTIVLNTSLHAVAGGATALTVLDLAGGNTIAGGAGGLSVSAGCWDVLSTLAGATDQVALARFDTLTGAGADHVAAIGSNTITLSGAATVALAGGSNLVQAGAGAMTLSDQVGADTILGGAGGITATLAGLYDSVTTAQGAADTVSIIGQSRVLSQGTDRITMQGNYNQVTAMGAAAITAAAGFSTFVLDGADSLSSAGGGVVTVGGGASATVASAGLQDLGIAKLAGGSLFVSESLAVTGSAGGTASLSFTGGAATVMASAGRYAGLRASLGSGASVTAGSGNATLTGSAGQNSIAGGAGALTVMLGAQDTVSMGQGSITVQGGTADTFIAPQESHGSLVVLNWSAQDSIVTPGHAAPAIASQIVAGGSTWLTMVGGAQIELVGVTHII